MAGSNEFSRRRAYLAAHLGIALLVAAAFSRTAFNGFIRYDDPAYLLDNKLVQSGLSAANVRWAFEGIHVSNWHPLTWLSHMLDCQLFGLDPAWHHLESVALHAIAAMLLLHFMTTTTRQPGRSFIAAALWAIHPLRVESVAWAAERKDVLSVLFGLACLVAYARTRGRRRRSAMRRCCSSLFSACFPKRRSSPCRRCCCCWIGGLCGESRPGRGRESLSWRSFRSSPCRSLLRLSLWSRRRPAAVSTTCPHRFDFKTS